MAAMSAMSDFDFSAVMQKKENWADLWADEGFEAIEAVYNCKKPEGVNVFKIQEEEHDKVENHEKKLNWADAGYETSEEIYMTTHPSIPAPTAGMHTTASAPAMSAIPVASQGLGACFVPMVYDPTCEIDFFRRSRGEASTKSRSQKARAPPPSEKGTWKPSTREVVDAVRSLYADGLKPFGRLLLKRVRETSAIEKGTSEEDLEAVPRVDPKVLRRVASGCKHLKVEPEDGREYSVYLVGQPANFVDVSSPVDNYPQQMWDEAAAYFATLGGQEALLPGGRYACAKLLLMRGLPFLMGRSLGEVCHIVQLAISQKRILGYFDGNMVPYHQSEERIKESCAVLQQPVQSPKRSTVAHLPHAGWVEARNCLQEILRCSRGGGHGGGAVTLSNVKRLFRSRFQLELSETVLGYPRLYELLQDERFSDICFVQPQSNGQVLVREATKAVSSPRERVLSEGSTTPPSSPQSPESASEAGNHEGEVSQTRPSAMKQGKNTGADGRLAMTQGFSMNEMDAMAMGSEFCMGYGPMPTSPSDGVQWEFVAVPMEYAYSGMPMCMDMQDQSMCQASNMWQVPCAEMDYNNWGYGPVGF